jgi:hypothetical protein
MGMWDLIRFGDSSYAGLTLIFAAVGVLPLLAMIWFLWFRSDWVARKIVPDEGNYSRWPRIRAVDLQVVAFSTVGLLTFLSAIRSFFQSFGQYMHASRTLGADLTFVDWFTMERTLIAFVEGPLGLWLMFGSRGFVRMLRRMRAPSSETELPPAQTEMEKPDVPPVSNI